MSIHNEPENDMEKVSIITPCYNASEYIQETYEYLKAQSHSNWEWIVFDDCSTDNSLNLLKLLSNSDKRVLAYENSKNSGAAVTRNNCLNKATGEFLAFLDVDDIWKPNKLKIQLDFMKTKKVNFSYHNYELVNAQAKFIKNQNVSAIVSAKDLLKFNPFATSSIIIKRDLIEKNRIRFKEHLRRRQDYLFWFDAISVGGSALGITNILSGYRLIGGNSLSGNKKKMAIIQWQLYRNEFQLNIFSSIYYFIHYAIHGIKKYLI
jgi:teichuronic acid biosynthesis glycosyltransferase TuaG